MDTRNSSFSTNKSLRETDVSMNESLFSPVVNKPRNRGWPKGVPRKAKQPDDLPNKVIE